jgi:5-methylcytosine-specific restriction endonuclease McrA
MNDITLRKCGKCGIEKEYTNEYFPIRYDRGVKGLRAECKECWNRRHKKYEIKKKIYKPKPKKVLICSICKQPFESHQNAKYCSDKCRSEKSRLKYHEKYSPVLNDYVIKECAYCGKEYKTNTFVDVRLYCSKRCLHKACKRERSYRKRGQFVANVYRNDIYKRDNYICQLCDERVDMNKVAPHPLSPTLDHIIPLSKGGTHEPSNVQLAHFICNSIKSDRIVEDIVK